MKYPFPKVDLHLHLDGSMLVHSAWEMARERNISLPASSEEALRDFIILTGDQPSVNEYLKRFELPLSILQDAHALIRCARELVELLSSQGLVYGEIRFAPQLHTRKGMSQKEAVEAVIEGVRQGRAHCPDIDIGILLCTMSIGIETLNEKENLETVRLCKRYLGKGVVGLDLAGAEGIVPLRNFAPIFALAKELELPCTCHAGDSQGADTVEDALDFGVSRLGHGHHIFESKTLCARAIKDGITLEICPTSNIQCCTRESYEAHPLKKLIERGLSCTINTDNMILSNIDLEKEYDVCLSRMGLSYEDLIRCNINSVKASFMPGEKKQLLIEKLLGFLN